MTTVENPTAGQGPVLLDIGGDVGALVVTMPPGTRDLEVEIRPAGATQARRDATPAPPDAPPHHHPHHDHDHAHSHDHGHDDDGTRSPYPHVGVVERRTAEGTHLSLVYPAVTEGSYELCPLPEGSVALTVDVVGGVVTEVDWPA